MGGSVCMALGLLLGGWMCGAAVVSSIAADCERLGAFRVGDKTYSCKPDQALAAIKPKGTP